MVRVAGCKWPAPNPAGSDARATTTPDLDVLPLGGQHDDQRGFDDLLGDGLAGVDLKDEDNTANPIERGPAQPRVTILKPGDAAVFDLACTIDNRRISPTGLASAAEKEWCLYRSCTSGTTVSAAAPAVAGWGMSRAWAIFLAIVAMWGGR